MSVRTACEECRRKRAVPKFRAGGRAPAGGAPPHLPETRRRDAFGQLLRALRQLDIALRAFVPAVDPAPANSSTASVDVSGNYFALPAFVEYDELIRVERHASPGAVHGRRAMRGGCTRHA
jgi:hypothetical protein